MLRLSVLNNDKLMNCSLGWINRMVIDTVIATSPHYWEHAFISFAILIIEFGSERAGFTTSQHL